MSPDRTRPGQRPLTQIEADRRRAEGDARRASNNAVREVEAFRRAEDRAEWADGMLGIPMRALDDGDGPTSPVVGWEAIERNDPEGRPARCAFTLADGRVVERRYPLQLRGPRPPRDEDDR